jgi:pyruvate,water dikinase
VSGQAVDAVLCRLTDAASISLCGGKAVALGRCLRAGVRVPDGLILTTAALRSQLSGASDGYEIGRRIRQAPLEASICDALRAIIYEWAATHGVDVLVVRSSAPVEDSQQRSFAGQFRSVFVQARPDALEAAVRKVWASVLDVADPEGVGVPFGMAVIIQVALRPRRSGVAFVELTRGQLTIRMEATLGLAVPLVNGMVRPDAAKAGPGPEFEFEFTAGSKVICALPATPEETQLLPGEYVSLSLPGEHAPAKLLFVDAEQQLVWLRIPPSHVAQSCLEQVLATKVTAAASELVGLYGHDLDVEWAEDEGGLLWIVQARPMTVPLPQGQLRAPAGTTSGLGVSSGSAQGCAHRLRDAAGVASVPPGAVLVCGAAKPQYMPAIARAAAIVSEDGGMLCHMAIVARELGKPCVVAIHDALERFVDGEKLYVDGDAGFVRTLTGGADVMSNEAPRSRIVRERCIETRIGVTPPCAGTAGSTSAELVVLFATSAVARDIDRLIDLHGGVLGILLPTRQVCDEPYLELLRARMADRPVTYGDDFEVRWLHPREGPDIDISAELQALRTPLTK